MMNEFDIKAGEWDKNPMHWDRSEAVAKEILSLIPLNKEMSALEYGAGTGITSFLLRDYLKEITLMDNSSEMIKVINEKIKASKVKNLGTLNFNLESDEYKEKKFDLIFTQMVLHHVVDIENIINKFHLLLNPGGFLVIADLYEEDGSFHGEGFTGHNGFNIDKLSDILRKKSFKNVSDKTCFIIDRKISETESKQFKVFIMTAQRD
ncbi:MAG TPA: class I SAM-dependent methyltransferase [Bacteroidales bacterium]|nr:class I SAM-dependent methyltransferase [Bacteroidales bacterium]